MQYRATCGKCGAVRIDSQIGLEPTLSEYLATMVDVFREVRRVLRPDGVCFINIGDSYAGGGGFSSDSPSNQPGGNGFASTRPNLHKALIKGRKSPEFKPKDMMMVPARLAIALCDDGWYLRSDIIWHKRAPMPESVTDRPTSAHEHIFLLTKQPRYFYDAAAVAEESDPAQAAHNQRYAKPYAAYDDRAADTGQPGNVNNVGIHARPGNGTRNLRNVWTLSPEPFPSAHFAVYPTELPRRCIKAGTSERGCCSACGAPWRRVVERKPNPMGINGGEHREVNRNGALGPRIRDLEAERRIGQSQTTGWQPSCSCPDAAVVPCTVLDPFGGAGTTGLVADELGRDCTLIELNPEYAEMSRSRIYGAAPMFAAVEVA